MGHTYLRVDDLGGWVEGRSRPRLACDSAIGMLLGEGGGTTRTQREGLRERDAGGTRRHGGNWRAGAGQV